MVSYLKPLLLCEVFARGVHFQCNYKLLKLSYSPISLIRIKGIQIVGHEIKVIHFADNFTIFLRDITRLNRIQVILKHFKNIRKYIYREDKLFKSQALWAGAYKNRIDQQGQMEWPQFSWKYLELLLLTLSLITPIGKK